MFEKFDIDDKNIFKVCVIATMSSGKSTFINAIIGEEIMPEKNEACTARTMAVLDNDSIRTKRAHIIRKNGDKEIVEIDSRDVLERVNNDEDVTDFVVETNILSIANTSRALMLVDTPGVNNSEDERHGQRTEEFLQQLDSGVIIFLMNATQLATNDDSILLQLVSEHVKKQNGNVKIFFVINKIDALDIETESIAGTVVIAKEYIENHGIKNPIIYPMSALAAKSLRMALYRREMTRRELRKLEDIYENYQSRDNNMLAYAMVDELSGEMYEIGDYKVSAQDLQRAIDNTGITAVEKKIESFMRELEQHFSPEIVMKASLSESVARKYQEKLNGLVSVPAQNSEKKFETLISALNKDRVMSGLNYLLGAVDEDATALDVIPDMTLVKDQFDSLIENIEYTKKRFFETFVSEKAIGAKHKKGIYFVPTSEEKEKVNAKFFFFVSPDGNKWELAKFGQISKYIEDNKEFYLFNGYEQFVFKVKNENSKDIIPLLDIRLPIRLIRIAKLQNSLVSIDEVYEHMKLLSNADAEKNSEIREAEEKLKRTYKGVLFCSEKEKDEAIKLEKEVKIYCKELHNHSFEELYEYKQKVSSYPNAIFASYITKFISALDIQESREKNIYLDRIEIAELAELDNIVIEIGKHNYSEATIYLLEKNINARKLKCQRMMLEAKVKDIRSMNRKELSELKIEIGKQKFAEEIISEYEEIVQRQYDTREVQELRELCVDIEQYDIVALTELENRIKKDKYQEKYANQYFELISSRIEHLHLRNIESICINVESANRETLKTIRKAVEDEDCKSGIKEPFLDRINLREEAIDYEDLCSLTMGLEKKSIEELDDLLTELSTGRYNEKFVKSFQLCTRVALERAQYDYLQDLTKDIDQKNKNEIHKIIDEIECKKYSNRVCSLINARIEERIYVLDMYELMDIKNEFDGMSLAEINLMRRSIKEKNVCQRSKDTYLKKLSMREVVIGYEKISPLASFAKHTIDQMGIGRLLNIKLATFSPDYLIFLHKHFEMLGKCDYEDVPVFILPECSSFSLNKKAFFCRTTSGYKEYRLDSIQSITVEKKFFSEYLMISLSNGDSVSLTAGINKSNSNALMSLLTLLIQNVRNEAMLSQYQPYQDKVFPIKEEDFEIRTVPCDVNAQVISSLLVNSMKELSKTVKMPSIKYSEVDNWPSIEKKVLAGFGISKEQHIVLYYDRTLFNSAKEGVALGEHFIHIKAANKNLISIPYGDIFDVDYSGNCLKIHTVSSGTFSPEFIMTNAEDGRKIVECISEFVKGIQFVNYNDLYSEDSQNASGTLQKQENKCPVCGVSLKIGAKFCAQCGMKIMELEAVNSSSFFFCSECGNKIFKGKKFCSQCGTRVEG